MKRGHLFIICGSLALVGALLILLSLPTSPIVPITVSFSIILVMFGIFEIIYQHQVLYTFFNHTFSFRSNNGLL